MRVHVEPSNGDRPTSATVDGDLLYVLNAGSSEITGFRVGVDGSLTILDEDGRTGEALVGVTDLAVSRDSQHLFGRLGGNGTVGTWAIAAGGSLTDLGPVLGLPAGTAGIAAT